MEEIDTLKNRIVELEAALAEAIEREGQLRTECHTLRLSRDILKRSIERVVREVLNAS